MKLALITNDINKFCIPESFNKNFIPAFSLQDNLWENKRRFFTLTVFKRSFQRFMVYKNKSDSDLV